MDRQKLFEGKTAIVTGAGSGIGAAVAKGLVAAGADVFAVDVGWAEQPVDRNIVTQHCDVTDAESVRRAFARCHKDLSAPDVVFNNAGIGFGGVRLHEVTPEDFEKVIRVNVLGSFHVLREALRSMLGSGGSIVNTASTSSLQAAPMTGAYSTSKGGILMLTKQAALEYAVDRIRVNCVCPGVTETPLLMNAPASVRDSEIAAVPLGRLARPEEIADLMLFLASDDASYVTGAAYVIDGGKCILTA